MSASASTSPIAAFCSELREAREYRHVSLHDVARSTRISLEYLQALESGRWEIIPRAYLRGYLALYAEAVEMNREKVLRTFDQLMAPPGTHRDGAVLDEAAPLLLTPEDVGVTRAKIRASWFAVFSRNRRMAYVATALSIVLLLIVLNITRRVRTEHVPLVPFSEAIAEHRERLHDPLAVLPLGPDSLGAGVAPRGAQWVAIVGRAPGWLAVQRDQDTLRRFLFVAKDTIKIQYLKELRGWIFPDSSALVLQDTVELTPVRVARGDTAVYEIQVNPPAPTDSARTVADSL